MEHYAPTLSRDTEIDPRRLRNLIQMERNVSSIELSLTAITIAVIALKFSFGMLSAQLAALGGIDSSERLFDVSIAVGFIGILIATLQIPKQFAETLIYSNLDALRLMSLLGASKRFVAYSFERVILRSLMRGVVAGLFISGFAYLVISELMQLWVPTTRTFFVREAVEVGVVVACYFWVVALIVRRKINLLFEGYRF